MRSAHGSYKKESVSLTLFHASLWAEPDRNTVCPWQLYGVLTLLWLLNRFVQGKNLGKYLIVVKSLQVQGTGPAGCHA